MKLADLTQLPSFLQARRWFSGKAWPIKEIGVVDHVTIECRHGDFMLGVVDVRYELGNPERYLLPLTIDSAGAFHEALDDDELARGLLRLIRDQETVQSGGGILMGEHEPSSHALWSTLPPSPRVRRLGVEQSNTSVIFDDAVILKVIRKLEPGTNPELEMGRFLLAKKFPNAPALLGSVGFRGSAEGTVAVAHAYVPNQGDGWSYVVEHFRRQPSPQPAFLSEIQRLGRRVGELHACLASAGDDPAFEPQPIYAEDLQRWSASIIGQLGVVIAEAEKSVPQLSEHRSKIMERARALASLTPSGLKLRVHGDLHLGQVLRTQDDWMIFDFEGEPGRTFSQRRELHSPLKDVAGMLRSFEYAEASVDLEGGAPGLRRTALTRDSFLNGYWEATRGAPFLPSEIETSLGLLQALELEKTIYELRYELHNRPSWVTIPARSLLQETSR